MTATPTLTKDLKRLVLQLEDDLREQLDRDDERRAAWQAEHHDAVRRQRTAGAWGAWRDDRITQVAVSWVLTTVFVRFCEDNALVTPTWITGPGPRRQDALDDQLAYFRTHPEHTDREWLEQAFAHLGSLPPTAALVDARAPFRLLPISGGAAGRMLDFWRSRDDDGALVHDLADADPDTRFLGDLYQDLSEHAKSTYALLQTPEFVEEFILDRTLEPALAERPLDGFKMIDPTCGSGHFLLGGFRRLLDRWHRKAPGLELQARVQQALDGVFGVDINPFAVAIARFRLLLAALKECGLTSLETAPALTTNLAVGDTLIYAAPQTQVHYEGLHVYAHEDTAALDRILTPGSYDAVVGNPPYITVKDKALNEAYRKLYPMCKGKYALTVPFMECFFGLARRATDTQLAGWVGQITSNSFMKREFGAPLIEEFLAKQDLRLVIDTSGAYIPGHGTPTVILVGRPQRPVGDTVRAVLGIRGEPGRPSAPEEGFVWSSIVEHMGTPGWTDEWVSVVEAPRRTFLRHPWSLTGGGANLLGRHLMANSASTLGDVILGKIGFASFPGADDAFFASGRSLVRAGIPAKYVREVVIGEFVRDWDNSPGFSSFTPILPDRCLTTANGHKSWLRRQWPLKAVLNNITGFGGETRAESGAPWWLWYRWVAARYSTPLSITFAFVATHNHFVLDRGGRVFKQSAPVIKLPARSTEGHHLALLAVLNSSAACFWLKQNSQNKAGGGNGRGMQDEAWEERYEFTGTTLQEYPLPVDFPLRQGHLIDGLARRLTSLTPSAVAKGEVPEALPLKLAREEYEATRRLMVAEQEELDFEVYRLYGILDDDLTYAEEVPEVSLGERAFEIALARRVAAGEETTAWFARHGSKPMTEIPEHWPAAYRRVVQRRLDAIESNPHIRLLEKPEYKRRWASEPWEKQQTAALRDWLLDRLEDRALWFDRQGRPQPQSVAQLADRVSRDSDLVSVLELWSGQRDVDVVRALAELLAGEAVPYLAAMRYKDSGLRKREAWEQTWALQRREDAGEDVGVIPVPPKYTSADFVRGSYWQARGKLDVPKERFISYPGAGRETDPTPLLGWAGWDHAQQALAIAVVLQAREEEGWAESRFTPLVAGLAELLPWVRQWHSDLDPTYGVSPAEFVANQLTERMAQVGATLDDLAAWRPEPPRRGRAPRKA
ncbi:hypothetical protein SAMN06264364_1306 [Quadrisphaera granulorum]|uniref:site-specific DNA-methyltransferase (adenine-specific) n=1 Tax=Quadrisphaera granulorum TaxID=317664 RepID=A0A315ZT12_9ACTN|nr:BREX-2 system adenine-specific DNA-methyltransferase PglX [Quadrisphaera granulorum]PWJ48442.1 hypothetical protein BXY45_1306 [Quadrisphaera granulorum]SZE98401.1 hypothetical protein SAMN06264364_1306 [Quadrisphaera granulorum]